MPLLPGSHVLSDHLPELTTPRGLLVGLAMVLVPGVVAFAVMAFLGQSHPTLALLAMIAVLAVAHWLLSLAADPANQPFASAVFNRYLPAVGLHAAVLLFILFNQPYSSSATYLFGNTIRWLFAAYFVIVGAAMSLRGVRAVGIDTIVGLYVYFPEEGRLVADSLYGALRHPIYGGLARIALGFAFLPGTAYAFLLAAIFAFAYVPAWVALEERELRRRFPDYNAYADERPALWPSSLTGELDLLRRVFLGTGSAPSASTTSA